MAKSQHVFYDQDARNRLEAGAEHLYKAVKVTMGPKGRNVGIKNDQGLPTFTHDGVTVARSIDIIEQKDATTDTLGHSVGADLIRQAANQNNDTVGDGTTTTTVIAYHLLSEANKLLSAGSINAMDLRRELEAAASNVLDALPAITEKIDGDFDKIAQVATISCGDEEIGKLIAEIIQEIGHESTVNVELSAITGVEKEIVEGFKFARGYISQRMVTDLSKMRAEISNPFILLLSDPLDSFPQLKTIFEAVLGAGKKDIVIIGPDANNEALATMILNQLKGAFYTLFIKAPGYGDAQKQLLDDMAILTGANVIGEAYGIDIKNASLQDLGVAKKIISDKDNTTIVQGGGDPEQIESRIDQLRQQAKTATNSADQYNLPNRASALAGKVGVIHVGGSSDAEVQEKKFRVDDAVYATRAAVAEGIVPGGGVALLDIARLGNLYKGTTMGEKILRIALEQPFKQLMNNAGISADAKLEIVLAAKSGIGVNVNDPGELVSLIQSGVIDPAQVTREAITNAVSVAKTGITMDALVVDYDDGQNVRS